MGRKPDKSKTVCVLLAVFFSFWTWLYTYKTDDWKFWFGLGASIIGLFLFLIPNIAVWIWSIVDSATKDPKKLARYW